MKNLEEIGVTGCSPELGTRNTKNSCFVYIDTNTMTSS